MKVIIPGHSYTLSFFSDPAYEQELHFINKAPKVEPNLTIEQEDSVLDDIAKELFGKQWADMDLSQRNAVEFELNKRKATLITIHDGTTSEEVLRVLVDRTQFLQSKFPCRENAIAITKMEEALMWFEKQTADRTKRQVEGKHIA
jgi:hypothetical protein